MPSHVPDVPERLEGDHPLDAILRRVWRRLNQKNEHWMHCIVGREGSGKSHTSLRLARVLDETVTADRVIFEPSRLLEILRDEQYESGQIYILDEAGVGLGKRTWQDRGQVKLNQALQLIRSHNIGVIFTLPRLGELDTQTTGRLHSYFEIVSKTPGEYVRGRWRRMDPDRAGITDEVYRKRPTHKGRKVDTVAVRPPEDEGLVAAYEERKDSFQKQFYDEALGELDDEADAEDTPDGPKEIADAIRENGGPEHYLREINQGTQVILDKDLIATDYQIGDRKAKKVKKLLLSDLDRGDVL